MWDQWIRESNQPPGRSHRRPAITRFNGRDNPAYEILRDALKSGISHNHSDQNSTVHQAQATSTSKMGSPPLKQSSSTFILSVYKEVSRRLKTGRTPPPPTPALSVYHGGRSGPGYGHQGLGPRPSLGGHGPHRRPSLLRHQAHALLPGSRSQSPQGRVRSYPNPNFFLNSNLTTFLFYFLLVLWWNCFLDLDRVPNFSSFSSICS